MLLYPTNYNQPQQGQQWGAWGAGDSNVGQAMPDYSQSTVTGAAPGWESMYSGGQVSQPASVAAFGAASPQTVAPPSAASFGGATQPDIGGYMKSLDWSNPYAATQSLMGQQKAQGWTNDQVGQSMGFTGDQVASHYGKYDPGSYMKSLDWANPQEATRKLMAQQQQQGWTNDQVGGAMGFTGQQVADHYGKYGGMGALGGAGGGVAYAGGNPNFDERTGRFLGTGNQVPIANDPNGGGNMSSNPYMSQQTDFLKQQMGDYLGRNLRGIRSNFVGSGGLGGSRQGIAEGQAIGDSVNSFGGQVANMLSGNYQFDRNLNTNSYNTNRSLDLQQEQLGANMLNQSTQMPWTPYTNASNMYSQYTGLGSQDSGNNWQQILGGALAGGQFARNMNWW